MEKKRWLVAEGHDWINGVRVPEDRIVELTDKEALYDSGLGRISLIDETEKPPEKPAKSTRSSKKADG